MLHEVVLTGFSISEQTEVVEVNYTWNGIVYGKTFDNLQQMVDQNIDLITSANEAVRLLLFYLLTLASGDGEQIVTFVGKKLTSDTSVAVQQSVSLT